jgi:putative thiamine transport system permease protein
MATALRELTRRPHARPGSRARAGDVALLLLFAGPVLLGVVGTLLPALGYLPELGGVAFSLDPFRRLFEVAGLWRAAMLSLATGLATAALSFAIVLAFAAHWHGTVWFAAIRRLLSPLLSVPPAAVAIGFAFLVAPSGWIFRTLAAIGLAGPLPPDLATLQDPYGLSLMLGLTLKETPFLLLMMLVALSHVRARESMTVARALGHARSAAWFATVLPQIYPQLRLPIYAVLAYSVSVVDVSLILGPTAPPTLSVLVWRGFQHPDLTQIFWACAGACLQLAIAGLAILIWRAGELGAAALGRRRIAAGWPGRPSRLAAAAALTAALLVVFGAGLGLVGTLLWSVSASWGIGSMLPESLGLAAWREQLPGAARAIGTTALLGISASAAALALVIAVLEQEHRQTSVMRRLHGALVYAPLVLPQIGFLFGVHGMLVMSSLDGTWPGLAWTHLLFVLPYVYLSLSEPWRALDPRYGRTALCLGRRPMAVLVTIKIPLLARPILVALALGFAVSVAQYLPTLFAGAGRFQTVTTEAVALAAGGDRRVVGVYAALQMLLPAAGFAMALALTRGRDGARGERP